MSAQTEIKTDVVILFAGDSGDGIQLTGISVFNYCRLVWKRHKYFSKFSS
jgi:hypothetical protein